MIRIIGHLADGSPITFDSERWGMPAWRESDYIMPGPFGAEPDPRGDGGIVDDAASMLERHAKSDK